MKFAKCQMVEYIAGEASIRAQILRAHRDGSCTIEARHHLDENKNFVGCYLGFKYRISNDDLSPA